MIVPGMLPNSPMSLQECLVETPDFIQLSSTSAALGEILDKLHNFS